MNPAATRKTPRQFVRTQTPVVERVLSVAVLILLFAIGAAVWWKGRLFDPGLYALKTEALQSTRAEVEGKAGTIRSGASPIDVAEPAAQRGAGPGKEYAETAEPKHAPGAPGATGAPLEAPARGVVATGPTEFYNNDNLYEKINGRAPAYESFNFQELRARSFRPAQDEGRYVDVLEFRMANPVGAFGIYAAERDDSGRPIDFAPEGYASEMGFFFRKGAHYVQVIGSDAEPATLALAEAVARAHAGGLADDDTGLAARRRLPVEDIVPESVSFVQSDALGLSFLKDVFQARYRFNGAELSFFVMAGASDSITKAYTGCIEFSRKYGRLLKESAAPDGTPYFLAENFGTIRVIFRRQDVIGGVFDAADAAAAEAFVVRHLGKHPE